MKVLALVEAVKTGEAPDGSPVLEPTLPALLRLDVPADLATPGQPVFVTVLVRVQSLLP